MTASQLSNSNNREIISVSELNRRSKRILETQFPLIWVSGEISNFACPSSGHWYFTLKDSSAQIRCAMFRNRNMRLRFKPKNGDQIIARARVSLYEGRGEYQLIVDFIEEAGDGALQRAFNVLKSKLDNEGLFDADNKQPLPEHPKRIGVITSPTGAAVRDIVIVLRRRFPAIDIAILPVAVQGANAASEITTAIKNANLHRPDLDLLIVGRGGGSLEDLQAFNDETVARAIYDSLIPIVSAVGHEVDFTIADFVADVRAATPSAAAELISPDQQEWLQILQGYELLFKKALRNQLNTKNHQLLTLRKRLRHPGSQLREQAQRLDDIEIHLKNAINKRLSHEQHQLSTISSRLFQRSPEIQLNTSRLKLNNFKHRLRLEMQRSLQNNNQRFLSAVQLLETVSPLATLNRGYAIIQDDKDQILRNTSTVRKGEQIKARLAQGVLHCTVDAIDS